MKNISAAEQSDVQRRNNIKTNFMRHLHIRRGVLPGEISPIVMANSGGPSTGRKFRKPLENRFPPTKPLFGLGMTAADFEDKTDSCSPTNEENSPTERNSPKAKSMNSHTDSPQPLYADGTDSDEHSPHLMSSSSVSSFGSSLTSATDLIVAQHVDRNGTIFFASSQSDNGQISERTPPSSVLTFDLSSHTSSDRTCTISPSLSLNNGSNADTPPPVFGLFHELQFLHSLGRRLGLDCNIRQDEGSFIFKHQMSNRMIVLTRSEALGEEGIRISQHKDGRIFRESYIPSNMENWMAKSLLRGLCEDFLLE